MDQQELKEKLNKIDADTEKWKIPAIIVYGIMFIVLIALFTGNDDTHSDSSSSYSTSSYSSSSNTSSYSSPNPNEWKPGITVVATPAQLGDDLIIRTRVNNRNSYAIDEKIYLYVVDGTDCKHFVDVLYADLQGGEVGNATSSIKTSKLGPPPYKIITE